jgi:exosortase
MTSEYRGSGGRLWGFSALAVLGLCSPFLVDYSRWMWSREHYQFFPLIVMGFLWLLYQRWAELKWLNVPKFSFRVAAYSLVSGLFFYAATVANSHWMGLTCCLLSLWTSLWLFGGSQVTSMLWGPFLFLLLLVPLPLNLDLSAINELQKLAAWLASAGLDAKAIKHTVSGVALRTSAKGYMVEEACSGIHSLFSAVSALAFYGVFSRYGLIRLTLLVVQTVLWVLVANAVRVFLIVYCDTRWQVALDTGWRHDALGFGVYAMILVMAVSTDRFVQFLVPASADGMKVVADEFFGKSLQSMKDFFTGFLDRPLLNPKMSVALAAGLAICCLPFSAMAGLHLIKGDSAVVAEVAGNPLGELLKEDAVDATWNGWTKKAFRVESRRAGDPFGTQSAVWTFEGHGVQANLSIDGWFPSWHDLTFCYQGIGWKVQDAANTTLEENGKPTPHTSLNLYRNTPAYALVMFTCFDSDTTAIEPPALKGTLFRTLRDRLLSLGHLSKQDQIVNGPVFQIQVFAQSDKELHEDEIKLLEQFLVHYRTQLIERMSKP